MSSDSPLKMLLTGNLEILKNDDPSLIDGFLGSFQGLEIKSTAALKMLFIRAAHFDSINIAKHMLNCNLIENVDAHDQGAMRSALRNNSVEMVSLLLDRGAKSEIDGNHCLKEACTLGAFSCIKSLILRARLSLDGHAFDNLLDKSCIEMVKNTSTKSPIDIIDALTVMKEEGASMHGKKDNLLSTTILACRNTEIIPVVKFLLSEGQTDSGYRAAKSALQTLINQAEDSNHASNKRDPHERIRELRIAIESANPLFKVREQRTPGRIPGF